MLQSNSAFLLSVFTEAEQDGETLVLNLGTLNDLAAFDRSFLLAFEDAPYRDDLFFRVEEDGVILARLELLPVGPILRFSKTLDPTEELGFNPRAGIEDQIAALAEFAPSHVTNPRQTPGRAKSTYGGYRITIGHNARRGRDRALNIDKVLKARRAGRRGLAKRIRAARAWHQSGEGKKWHQAQARYQKQHSSVIKDMQSFLAEMTTRRFHKGWGECVIEKNFDKVESQPVHLRAFMSGKDLALGEMSLFFFDQDDAVQVVKAHEVLSRAALDEMAAVFQFKNQAAREKAAGEVQAGGGTIARQGMKALVLTSKTTPTEIAAFVKIIGKYGGSRIRESQRNAVLDEVVLHRLAQRTAEQFEYTSIEEMPCGAVYVERESGEVVVSVCEHLLTDEQVNVLKESFCTNGQTLRVFEDHYDPMRMLRECALSVATEGEEIVQVGPRSWIVDGERFVFYSPRMRTVRVLPLQEAVPRVRVRVVSFKTTKKAEREFKKYAATWGGKVVDWMEKDYGLVLWVELPQYEVKTFRDNLPRDFTWDGIEESLAEMSPGGLHDMLHDMGYPDVSDDEIEQLRLAALQGKNVLKRKIEKDTGDPVFSLMLDALYVSLLESKNEGMMGRGGIGLPGGSYPSKRKTRTITVDGKRYKCVARTTSYVGSLAGIRIKVEGFRPELFTNFEGLVKYGGKTMKEWFEYAFSRVPEWIRRQLGEAVQEDAFDRAALKDVMRDVKKHATAKQIKDAWSFKTRGLTGFNYEFHGPDDFFWHGQAGGLVDAKVQGWHAWLRHIEAPGWGYGESSAGTGG